MPSSSRGPRPATTGCTTNVIYIDEPVRGERRGELHSSERDAAPRLFLEPSDGVDDIAPDEFGVPVDGVEGSGCHDLPYRIHHLRERNLTVVHPVGPLPRLGSAPRAVHQLTSTSSRRVRQGRSRARTISGLCATSRTRSVPE